MASVRDSLGGWLRIFLVIALVLQSLAGALLFQPGDANADGTQAVHCLHGDDCPGHTGGRTPAHDCDSSQGHTPTGLTDSRLTAVIASSSSRSLNSAASFSAHIPKLPSRPPLAVPA